MITKEDLLRQLETFHIAKGKPVIVHSSLKAIGQIHGSGETLLSTLIEYFTADDGLLCIPTHTWACPNLDLNKAETCLGVLPNLAAGHPDATRTLHPTHSMAVFGESKRVEQFIAGEDKVDIPVSPKGCYGRIYSEDGYVLLVGVGHEKNTFLHCVEEMLHIPNRLMDTLEERVIIHKNGQCERRYLHPFKEDEIPDVSLNFGKYEPAFRHHSCILDGQIGNACTQLCSARKMKEVVELIHKNSGGIELLADNLPLDEQLYTCNICAFGV